MGVLPRMQQATAGLYETMCRPCVKKERKLGSLISLVEQEGFTVVLAL